MLDFHLEHTRALTRRQFFCQTGLSLGAVALGGLLSRDGYAGVAPPLKTANPLAPRKPHFAPKAKSIIYLDMSGAPPSLDMFDWKPKLAELNLKPCPKMLGSPYKFAQYGSSGAWVSELLPHFTEIVDDVALIRSMWTDQFNHAPAELFIYTGSARAGAASMGSWLTYGLGTENQDLPGFVVLLSGGTDPTGGKSLWGSGFLPSLYQGVQCRSAGEPILFANNPAGMDRASRRRTLDALDKLDEIEAKQFGDPETVTRIAQYIHEMYGTKPGEASFANNCLLARRLVERGVRYVQLYDWGWDIHGTGPGDDLLNQFPKKCRDVDRACAALIKDLKQRGLLEETLVIWGGEFGRTPMNEARGGSMFLGRDHHPHCFTIWMAGGGIQPGIVYGETDELGYSVVKDKVSVRDLQTTILHLMGLDAHQLNYRFQGLNQRCWPDSQVKTVAAIARKVHCRFTNP
ncbi:MAG: sulfatase [Verrucomicrobia bacterium]|nr:MAG: sulfatase [Verrucomicrobiota bacterium]